MRTQDDFVTALLITTCILLAMLLITYYMNPETGRPWKKR